MEGRVRWKVFYSCSLASEYPNLSGSGAKNRLCLLRTVVATKVKKDEHLLQAE